MGRQICTADDVREYLSLGWSVAWFGIEDGELELDLCVNWRLQDGKVLFLRCSDVSEVFIVGIAAWMRKAWVEEAAKCLASVDEWRLSR